MSNPVLTRPLLHMFHVAGLKIQQGSDHHAPLAQADHFAEALIAQKRDDADVYVFNGDIFDATDGQSTQQAVGDLLRAFARKTDKPIIFVPGNHCLRGFGHDAWNNFGALPPNVIAPLDNPTSPITLEHAQGDIVAGNIFYDFDFFDPTVLGFTKSDLADFYRLLPDGEYLLDGQTGGFKEMANNMATAITSNVGIIITHCVPHPSLVSFKASEKTDELVALAQKLNTTFLCDPVADEVIGKAWGQSAEEHRQWWNRKIYFMGSDILSHSKSKPRDGLVVFSGHNHRSESYVVREIGGKSVVFCSFQFPLGLE